jgi:hypothetical protein
MAVRAVSTSSYSIKRQPRDRYKGRDKYLSAKLPGAAQPTQLCQAIEATLVGRAKQRSDDPERVWDGFPWLTLVLGSGCLDLPDEPGFTPSSLAQGVADALGDLEWSDDGSDNPAGLAHDFTEALARDRIRTKSAPGSEEPSAHTLVVDPVAAKLALIAALLTRFFHLAQAVGPTAMSRWNDDVARLDAATAMRFTTTKSLEQAVVTPAIRYILDVKTAFESAGRPDDPRVAAVKALLDNILADLHPIDDRAPRTVYVEQLRLLTEIAWHFLIRDSSVYPGWTDLLLDLMLKAGEADMKGSRRARPRYANLQALPDIVAELLEPATISSWNLADPANKRATPRDELYGGVAEVLWAQFEALEEQANDTSLPPAAAFVTSFDLELEMALWARAEGRTFSVAVPVHIFQSAALEEAELCWLLGDVEVVTTGSWAGQLDRIRYPTNWRLLTPEFSEPRMRAHPTVIHLGGCPLFQLPDLTELARSTPGDELVAELERVGVPVDGSRTTITHAVTVDEYLALRQSEAELFWMSSHHDDPGRRRSRALPPYLTRDRPTNPRFWMAIGLPIADPAIRHRVVSQITVRRLRDGGDAHGNAGGSGYTPKLLPERESDSSALTDNGSDAEYRRSDVDGIAINLRIDDDEASLLYWLGLDVVEADCRAFTGDLFHHADHVRDGGTTKRPSTSLPCTIKPSRGSR